MFREQFKLVEITPFECVSSTQNSCRKTMLNVEAAIERLVMSTNRCACSTSFLFVRFTHKSMCYSNKPLIGVEPTNRVCEYGPRSPTHFFVLDQLTLFNSVLKCETYPLPHTWSKFMRTMNWPFSYEVIEITVMQISSFVFLTLV